MNQNTNRERKCKEVKHEKYHECDVNSYRVFTQDIINLSFASQSLSKSGKATPASSFELFSTNVCFTVTTQLELTAEEHTTVHLLTNSITLKTFDVPPGVVVSIPFKYLPSIANHSHLELLGDKPFLYHLTGYDHVSGNYVNDLKTNWYFPDLEACVMGGVLRPMNQAFSQTRDYIEIERKRSDADLVSATRVFNQEFAKVVESSAKYEDLQVDLAELSHHFENIYSLHANDNVYTELIVTCNKEEKNAMIHFIDNNCIMWTRSLVRGVNKIPFAFCPGIVPYSKVCVNIDSADYTATLRGFKINEPYRMNMANYKWYFSDINAHSSKGNLIVAPCGW